MCGLAGMVDPSCRRDTHELMALASRMADVLVHRGPDSGGTWVDAQAGVALGHRRLAIIDLSPSGHQPMTSGSGRYVISYNGESYNFGQLRTELKELGQAFSGQSDTEVLLAGVDRWGLEATLEKLVGMFAFALWDRRLRTLHLVRDRLGEKPMYFGRAGGSLVFGSELKALREHPQFSAKIDRGALALFLRHKYVPAPYSIYTGVYKLPAGTLLSLPADGGALPDDLLAHVRPYWSLQAKIEASANGPPPLADAEAVESMDRLLREAVAGQMIADVSLGAFLSGGIDSSTVVALMQSQSNRPVKTFTVGFDETAHNEAQDAAAVAAHLNTEHAEIHVTSKECRDVSPRLAEIYDEPFADESQIPTYLIAAFARREVTVALSGDGGDEVFGGYTRHFVAPRLWDGMRMWPHVTRRALARALTSIPTERWDAGFERLKLVLPRSAHRPTPGDHLHKLANLVTVDSPVALYRRLTSHWPDPEAVVIGGIEHPTRLSEGVGNPQPNGFVHWMMYHDTLSYLPDDILVKVDRASMAVSLEARAPFLDHRVVEFAWRLPVTMKVRNGRGKWLLRQVLARYLPDKLIDRPKQGFTVPIGEWLRGPLRDWAEASLDSRRLAAEGFFHPPAVREKWTEHSTGRRSWSSELWSILMFQAWQERWHQPSRGVKLTSTESPTGLPQATSRAAGSYTRSVRYR